MIIRLNTENRVMIDRRKRVNTNRKISVPMKKYRKLCPQNSEEIKITWVMIVETMGL